MKRALDLSRIPHPRFEKRPIAGLSFQKLHEAAKDLGLSETEADMRARQMRRSLHYFGVTDFADMAYVAKTFQARLADTYCLDRPDIAEHQVSTDGTQKWLVRFGSNAEGETVFIPDVARSGALCVSSQVGCTLNCTFCHTGTQRLVRNLTAQEIVGQVLIARDGLGDWPANAKQRQLSNIVFMGMGEPLYNLENVVEAIDTLADGEGIGIGRRRITVSTSGIAPKIPELGARTGAMLAISLHAVRDDLRDEIVPINRKYDLQTLFDAVRAYPGLGNSRRVAFEYVMLKGINDSLAEARDMVRLLSDIPAKINLIPFNPWPGTNYQCSDWDVIEAFADILNRAGYASPIRTPRGRDIFAACGQLRSESEKQSAAARRKAAIFAKPVPA
ncbi:MAG: 23S rRNA (adenine(2503)-C(2))-methyltransferase RlmN [Pseudomonadota bacterium]